MFRLSSLQRLEKSSNPQTFQLSRVSTPFPPSSPHPLPQPFFLIFSDPVSYLYPSQTECKEIYKYVNSWTRWSLTSGSPKAASMPHIPLASTNICKGNNGYHSQPNWVSLRNSWTINYWVSISEFPWLPSTCLKTSKLLRPPLRLSHPLAIQLESLRELLSLPAPNGFLQTSHKVSGKRSNCSLLKLDLLEGKVQITVLGNFCGWRQEIGS